MGLADAGQVYVAAGPVAGQQGVSATIRLSDQGAAEAAAALEKGDSKVIDGVAVEIWLDNPPPA